MGLKEKISIRASGIFLYGLIPPKVKHDSSKVAAIAKKQADRIRQLPVDGLILYDIHDEKDRNDQERTFPYLETIDPKEYAQVHLGDLDLPKVIYRCVGKYSKETFKNWLKEEETGSLSVFVGAASSQSKPDLPLGQAYNLYKDHGQHITLGGVCIPERHHKKSDEHLRLLSKQARGCQFFISQAVYNLEEAKNFLSDYYYHCYQVKEEMVPIIFTLSPCGSKKTLDFLKWLGISISKWLENDILNSRNSVMTSVDILCRNFQDLWTFAQSKGIPIGCNIESIATSRKEIDASVILAEKISKIMG